MAQAWRTPATRAGDPLVRQLEFKFLGPGLERSHDPGVQARAVRRRLALARKALLTGQADRLHAGPGRVAAAGGGNEAGLPHEACVAAERSGVQDLQVDRGTQPVGRSARPWFDSPWLRV